MTTDVVGYKGGLRGAQMFRRRVEDLFEIIDECVPDDDFTGWGNKDVFPMDLSRFKRIDATGYFGLHDDEGLIDTSGFVGADGRPDVWPFRAGIILDAAERPGNDGWGEGSLECVVCQGVTPEAVRGRVKLVSRYMATTDRLVLHKMRGKWRYIAMMASYAWLGRRWVDAGHGVVRSDGWRHGKELARRIITPGRGELMRDSAHVNAMIGFAKLQRAYWYVEIGRADGASFSFATLPSKIAGVYKARDIEDGAKRRAALRNWVVDHWRSDVGDPEFEVYVRKHLRGAETFSWGGYYCTIHPAAIDLEEDARAQIEREMMGAQARRKKQISERPRYRVPARSVWTD